MRASARAFPKANVPRSCPSLVQVIHRIFERIDYKKDNKIDKEELEHTLRSLGYEPVRVNQYGISEVEQMIWEVDEDCDGCVSLEEFQQMFDRGRNDKTGNEPRKLFNLCQFMVLDRDGDGSVSPSPTSQSVRQPMLLALTTQHVVHIQVSTEECMEMIMHRYGPDTLKKLWKESSHVQEREITLSDFLLQVNRSSQKAAREANKEKNLPAIKKRVNPQK